METKSIARIAAGIAIGIIWVIKKYTFMKSDGTPTIDEILSEVEQLQEFEKKQLIDRILRGGITTIKGRYNFRPIVYRHNC